MEPREFWSVLFAALYREAPTVPGTLPEVEVLSAHGRFYGAHLGPSGLTWPEGGFCWVFHRCPHGHEPDICEAHIGFVSGLVQAKVMKDVVIARRWDTPKCTLDGHWVES